jgi:hypothetical protein
LPSTVKYEDGRSGARNFSSQADVDLKANNLRQQLVHDSNWNLLGVLMLVLILTV